jgi:transcriptional regulator with XRE-family HTH domain
VSFQDNLKKCREKSIYNSAKEFAKALQIPYQTYLNYENKGTEPKYDILCAISEKLHTSPNELLDYKPPNQLELDLETARMGEFEATEEEECIAIRLSPMFVSAVKSYSNNQMYIDNKNTIRLSKDDFSKWIQNGKFSYESREDLKNIQKALLKDELDLAFERLMIDKYNYKTPIVSENNAQPYKMDGATIIKF